MHKEARAEVASGISLLRLALVCMGVYGYDAIRAGPVCTLCVYKQTIRSLKDPRLMPQVCHSLT